VWKVYTHKITRLPSYTWLEMEIVGLSFLGDEEMAVFLAENGALEGLKIIPVDLVVLEKGMAREAERSG